MSAQDIRNLLREHGKALHEYTNAKEEFGKSTNPNAHVTFGDAQIKLEKSTCRVFDLCRVIYAKPY